MKPERIYIGNENVDLNIIKKVASFIRGGKIVALPTETVYGLAANLNRPDTIEKLYRIKGRLLNKPSTIHIGAPEDADFFIDVLPPYGYRLIGKFWPGPLTIIYYRKDSKDSVGLRCPDHPVTSLILKESLCKVIMPSANISGRPPAISAQEVEEIFDGQIDFIVESLPCKFKISSTIVDLTKKPLEVIREGVISKKEIENAINTKRILFVCTGNTCRSVMAEYLLKLYLKKRRVDIAEKVEVFSCGIQAPQGGPPSEEVIKLLLNEGIDSSQHTSQKITRYLIRSSDVIIVMDKHQRDIVVGMENLAMSRTFLMGSFLKDYREDIPDPIGGEEEDFQRAFYLIKEGVEEIVDWL